MEYNVKRLQQLAGILKENVDNIEVNKKIDDDKVHVQKDHEGKMAKKQLGQILDQASTLLELMPEDAELEAWVQSKLTLACDMLDVVTHYLLDENPTEEYVDDSEDSENLMEAEYQGREVPLNKPMQGDVKKFKVYVKDPSTKRVKKVNFGDPNMRIKKSNPERRKSFRARHNCDNPGPKTKARYWSCKKW